MKTLALVMVTALLATGSVAQATIIMDATHHNGDITPGAVGFWYNTPAAVPTGWTETANYMYSTAVGWIQAGSQAEAVNNTGETVHTGEAFTISALVKGDGANPLVRVFATQNADGSGTNVLLASVQLVGGSVNWTTMTGAQGAPADASLEGYYVQVNFGGPWSLNNRYIAGDYDSITVTSEIVPEPATMALLGLGGLLLRRKK